MTVKCELLKESVEQPSWVICSNGHLPTVKDYKADPSKYDQYKMKHGIYRIEFSISDMHFWNYSNNQRTEIKFGEGYLTLPISLKEIFSYFANQTIQSKIYGADVITTIVGKFSKKGSSMHFVPLKDLSEL